MWLCDVIFRESRGLDVYIKLLASYEVLEIKMNNIRLVILTLFYFIFSLSSLAEEARSGKERNGCGTKGIQGILVPDSTLFSKCYFHEACDTHDLCYGRCLKGGDLFGKELCNDPIAKESRRNTCDTNFFNDIVEDNNGRSICKFYGKIYRFAVVRFGKGNFNGKELEDMALSAFEKGEVEAEEFYINLSIVQEATFSPQIIKLDQQSKELILQQKDIEIQLDQIKLDSMANKVLQRMSR